MYSTCFHCQRDLGRNEVVEHLPIGRRLAYDAAAGRIWVICPHCSRWNLVPYESRWEAIDEAERTFRTAPLRASTDNVALAKTGEGAELVRIGKPIQQELASWRYGRHFAKRRWNYLTTTAPMTAGFFLLTQFASHPDVVLRGAFPNVPYAFALGVPILLVGLVGEAKARWHTLKTLGMLRVAEGTAPISRAVLDGVRIAPGDNGGLHIWVPVLPARIEDRTPFLETARITWSLLDALVHWDKTRQYTPAMPTHHALIGGSATTAALRTLLPVINERGASSDSLRESLEYLQRHNHDPAHIAFGGKRSWELASNTPLKEFHHERRLALEMAVHADSERRWLEGDMQALLEEWRRADEIASIADGLLRDPAIEAKLDALRDGPALRTD